MKLLFLTFSFVLASIFSLSAQNIPQPTHYIYKIAGSASLPLENFGAFFTYYDNNGNTYQTKYNRWDGGNWVLGSREYYTLNAEGKPVQKLKKTWDEASATLVDADRTTLGYHSNGLENFRKSEFWDAVANLWQTRSITSEIFGLNDKLKEITFESYFEGVLTFGSRTIYAYDGANRILETIRQTLVNGVWTNQQQTNYVYNDADDDYDEASFRNWNEPAGAWGDVAYHETQTVTSNQRIIMGEFWDGLVWIPSERNTTNYDANDQQTDYTSEEWVKTTSTWRIHQRYEFVYNNDRSINQLKYYIKDFDTEVLYLNEVVDFDYGMYAVSTQTPALQAKVSVSPNPTADFVHVELEGKAISNITLLDLHGNALASTTTACSIAQLSLQAQPAGTYFLRVEQGGAIKVLPVVKK